MKHDKDYRDYRNEIQKKWRSNNHDYMAQYKKSYTARPRPHRKEVYKIKILVGKNALRSLSSAGKINCACQLVLA
ncbi:MAG: hypothetical protein WCH10_06940 [bacterium]